MIHLTSPFDRITAVSTQAARPWVKKYYKAPKNVISGD
jgi:hypothetical protein